MNLTDKVAIVSGGARDIGRAVSVKLAAEGAKVVVNYYKSKEQAAETLSAIKTVSGEEVADTVAYLASSESSFLTGVNLDINGGLYYS